METPVPTTIFIVTVTCSFRPTIESLEGRTINNSDSTVCEFTFASRHRNVQQVPGPQAKTVLGSLFGYERRVFPTIDAVSSLLRFGILRGDLSPMKGDYPMNRFGSVSLKVTFP